MSITTTLKRLERLETAGSNPYQAIADEAFEAKRITAEERDLYLNFIKESNSIPPIMWIDTDTELMLAIRKIGIYPNSVWDE
jgi:hypothetical protein